MRSDALTEPVTHGEVKHSGLLSVDEIFRCAQDGVRVRRWFSDGVPRAGTGKEITMTEEKWLDGYSGQTVDELIALEGEYRTDSLVLAFEQALDQKADRVGEEGLTEAERVVLAVEALEREVNNGGYLQFFTNSSKQYTPIIVDALQRIGCAETAQLTQQAIDVLGIEGPITIDAIDHITDEEDDEREERWDECDARYYEIARDLAGPLLEYIKSNRDKITLKE